MTTDFSKKRRARRIASDEAHAWARSLTLDNPNGKSVLRALTLYVNGEGCCFVSIEQLAEDTDLSTDTVRRRLVWLDQVGAIVRMPQWLDENGRRNTDGRGRRTTDEIRLLLDADADEIERRAKGDERAENEGVSTPEASQINPSPLLGQNEDAENAAESVSPRLALGQPSQSCHPLTSEPEPEDSPPPPSGGSVDLEGWKEFEGDWTEPILRQSLAQQVWSAFKPEERNLARKAARGYFAWRKRQKSPPNVIGAHLFLKERDAWAKFAELDPGGPAVTTGVAVDSDAGRAIIAIYAVARVRPFESQRRIVFPGEITPQILAFANAPDRSSWTWIEDHQQIGAWSNFLNTHVRGVRPALLVSRGIGADQRNGIYAPWLYPPSATGKPYPAGPPEALMSDEDFEDFK